MIDKKYFNQLKKDILNYAKIRREVIKNSGDALHLAKRAIFALHRGEMSDAEKILSQVEKMFLDLDKKYVKEKRIVQEGAYKAALEEYVEAKLFLAFCQNKKISIIKKITIPAEIYVSGLADVPGEIYRYTVKAATARDLDLVKRCLKASGQIIASFMEMNLTGYTRQKFDQAKSANAKIEQVVYDLSLRGN